MRFLFLPSNILTRSKKAARKTKGALCLLLLAYPYKQKITHSKSKTKLIKQTQPHFLFKRLILRDSTAAY